MKYTTSPANNGGKVGNAELKGLNELKKTLYFADPKGVVILDVPPPPAFAERVQTP